MHKNIFYSSLYRPILFVGCEKLPFTMVTLLSSIMILVLQDVVINIIALAIYAMSVVMIRQINTHDPQFFECMFRYFKTHQAYYSYSAIFPGRNGNPYVTL